MGISTAHISRTAKKGAVRSYEASPVAHACAQRTVTLNGLRNVDLRHDVLSADRADSVPFFLAEHFLVNSLHPMAGGREVQVPAHFLEDVLQEVQPQAVVMDIEGGEYRLLSDPAWQRCSSLRALVVEFHPLAPTDADAVDLSPWFSAFDCTLSWQEIRSIRKPTTVAFRKR